MILIVAATLLLMPTAGRAAQATYTLVVGVSDVGGGSLGLCKVVGREYTLEMLPKSAQFAVLGDIPSKDKPLYKMAIKDLVAKVETAMGVKINRYVRVDDQVFVGVVNRLGGLKLDNKTYAGQDVLSLLQQSDGGLQTRQLKQAELAKLLIVEALKPVNWLKLPGIVRAVYVGVETNYTLLNMLGMFVLKPTITVKQVETAAVLVNNQYKPTGLPLPIIRSGRTLVPLRMIEEMTGAVVSWNENLKQATVDAGGKRIVLTINNKVAYVNGKARELGVAPTLHNSRTMVPFRFIFEELGYKVEWIEKDFVIKVSK